MANGRSKGGYLGIAAFAAVVIFLILSTTVFFKIDTITVKGSSIYTAEEICAASGIKSGNNLIRTNMSKAAANIENTLIYIETAELKRSFPSGVVITVSPCREAISAEYEDGFCLLSEKGKVLKTSETPFPTLSLSTVQGLSRSRRNWLKPKLRQARAMSPPRRKRTKL